MTIKNVTIVGGGSSGWMTAAALSKLCPHLTVSLVESAVIKTIGVGESTLGHINRFFSMLDLKDEDWMPACMATYKNSIRFTNFRQNDGTSFEYPFSYGLDFTDAPNGIHTWSELALRYPDEFTPETFAEFYVSGNTFLAKYNKQSKNEYPHNLRHFNFKWDTAYHLDAQALGDYLRDTIAIPLGVKHIIGDVEGHQKNENGDIISIQLKDGTELKSDLWIDCTGFRSVLLEGWMQSEFISFEKYLANDSAIACRIPYVDKPTELLNVTDCHALGNGWVWYTPLWNRIGTGYVYSSKFISQEDAEKEFREHLAKSDKTRAEEAVMNHVKIKHGYRKRAWVNNVVGIGLSYGFVEPLESTGLLTIHENLIKLVEVLNRRQGYITRTEKEAYNLSCEYDVLRFRDFVSQHYSLSMRTDTPYWQWCTQLNEYCPEQFGSFKLFNEAYPTFLGMITNGRQYSTDFMGNTFIAAGMGVRPISTEKLLEYGNFIFSSPKEEKTYELENVRQTWNEYKEDLISYIQTLPSSYEFLQQHIYKNTDNNNKINK